MMPTTLRVSDEEPSGKMPAAQVKHADDREHIDTAELLHAVNGSNEAVGDQYSRVRQAADMASRAEDSANRAAERAAMARVVHRMIQAERPQRHAPRPQQILLALVTVVLDGVACYFAAQVLGGTQSATLVWTALFLAVLGGGELALDVCRDRQPGSWRLVGVALGLFVTGLGVLRFWFLATVGTGALVPAVAGAVLFTAATAGFLYLGYRALRAAETTEAWRARRQARAAAHDASAARATADRRAAELNRLADAYISHQIRPRLLEEFPASQQHAAEEVVRALLLGRDLT